MTRSQEEEVGRLTAERNDSVIEAIVRKETYICS
jgi:hypothetical protein